MSFLFLKLIKFYQFFSPDHGLSRIFGGCCRFYPSCSQYAYEAIEKYGTIQGIRLACERIIKCHPWNKGGYNPISENPKHKAQNPK